MKTHNALLVQDVSEYIAELKDSIEAVLEAHRVVGISHINVIEWIIAEEIEHIYQLFSDDHRSKQQPHSRVYDYVKNQLGGSLSILTAAYIKAPAIYPDNRNITIRIIDRDLFICYYKASNLTQHSPSTRI